MAIDFGLAPRLSASDYLGPLQAMAAGQQARRDELTYARQLATQKREDDTREAYGEYFRASRAGPAPIGVSHNGVMPVPGRPEGQSGYVGGLLGGPARAPAAAALDTLSRLDPATAARAETETFGHTRETLKLHTEINQEGIRLLSGVRDQASLDAARTTAARMYGAYGLNLDDMGVPTVYSPEAINGLLMTALDADKALGAARADRRLNWDIADDEADNGRADRNATSVIQHRRAQERLTARGQDVSDARGRYGIQVSHGDRVRGQDMADVRGRRGQDLTDARARAGAGSRTGGARAGNTPITHVATNGQGEKVGWNGRAWVPIR